MAITNGYITLANFKEYAIPMSAGTNAEDDALIEILIEGVSRYIDGATGRRFYRATETHYFDVPGGRELIFDDDLISVTTLKNGNAAEIASTEYNLLPKNKTPYYGLKLKESSSVAWYPDNSNNYEYVISLLGSWGYAATAPKDIELATYEIAKSAYHRRKGENIDAVARATAAGVLITPRDISSFAASIISKYRKMI